MSTGKAYLEHVAIYVRDINWHISFFEKVFGMTIRKINGAKDSPDEVFLYGGIQLIALGNERTSDGHLAHLGIMSENSLESIKKAYDFGVTPVEKKDHWVRLPEGLYIEILQAKANAVQEYFSISPR